MVDRFRAGGAAGKFFVRFPVAFAEGGQAQGEAATGGQGVAQPGPVALIEVAVVNGRFGEINRFDGGVAAGFE